MNLIKLILAVFQNYLGNIFIIQESSKYTYRDVLNMSLSLSKRLDDYFNKPIKIALIANNSLEWIVAFFAILLSKHKLVLFSPNLSNSKIIAVIRASNCSLLMHNFIDKDDLLETVSDQCKIMHINDISHYKSDKTYHTFIASKDIFTSLEIYTPRSLSKVVINSDKLVALTDALGKHKIFDDSTSYVADAEFSYNYVLGLLLPFINGITIIIPRKRHHLLSHGEVFISAKYESEVVILNARQFKEIYQEYIEEIDDLFNDVLKFFNLWFIRKYYLKRKFNKVFLNLKKLIILNSKLDVYIQKTLKKLKVPFTVTYGRVEDGGISTYSDPKDYIIESVGKFLLINLTDIDDEDLLYQNNDGIVYFDRRKSDEIKTAEGFIISEEIERILSNIPYVKDCLLCNRNNKLYLIVYLDHKQMHYRYMKPVEAIAEIKSKIIAINKEVNTFERIQDVCQSPLPFETDSYGRILKEYYV